MSQYLPECESFFDIYTQNFICAVTWWQRELYSFSRHRHAARPSSMVAMIMFCVSRGLPTVDVAYKRSLSRGILCVFQLPPHGRTKPCALCRGWTALHGLCSLPFVQHSCCCTGGLFLTLGYWEQCCYEHPWAHVWERRFSSFWRKPWMPDHVLLLCLPS